MGDKPTKCSCVAPFYADEYGKTIEVVIERCDWCKGLQAQLQAANAVCLLIDMHGASVFIHAGKTMTKHMNAYRATQKGGA